MRRLTAQSHRVSTNFDDMPQSDPLLAFDRFKLFGEELAAVSAEFTAILETTDLARSPTISATIARYKNVPGVYFWTALLAGVEYKIYAGQTNSLGYRVYNYTAPFQPHSPNDFKLLIFRAFLEQLVPGAVLRLRFREISLDELKAAERRVIERYAPLLNVPRAPTPEAKRQLQEAFASYYRSSFEGVLKNAA